MSKTNSELRPTLDPPADLKSKTAVAGKTTPMENISIISASNNQKKNNSNAEHLSPSISSPSVPQSREAGVATVTTWSAAATINALWSINQDKNSWISDASLGWKKLSNASDSGIVALTILSSHAKQLGSTVYYRTEDDGMVHEIYVW